MALLDGPMLIGSGMLPRWEWHTIGFSCVRGYIPEYYKRYMSLHDAELAGYQAATPSGYSQGGWENTVEWGKDGIKVVHVDIFTLEGTWVAA